MRRREGGRGREIARTREEENEGVNEKYEEKQNTTRKRPRDKEETPSCETLVALQSSERECMRNREKDRK